MPVDEFSLENTTTQQEFDMCPASSQARLCYGLRDAEDRLENQEARYPKVSGSWSGARHCK
ncbi:hypothetical protein HAX54_013168, partial [Datura stramonium]|nr:hypothetical protein [Datura stramonium]